MSLKSALPALAAAALFGASTPLAKLLAGDLPPLLLAGLLYLGSGAGLAMLLAARIARDPGSAGALLLCALRVPICRHGIRECRLRECSGRDEERGVPDGAELRVERPET